MKKHSQYLLTMCVIALGIMTVHTNAAHAALCPDPGVVTSYQVETTPDLECLAVEMEGRCSSVGITFRNNCDKTVTLKQTDPTCRESGERTICEGVELRPAATDRSKSFVFRQGYETAQDQEVIFEGTYGEEPLIVNVKYSAKVEPYDDGDCTCSSLNQTAPLAPLSVLGALALVGTVTVRNRRRR